MMDNTSSPFYLCNLCSDPLFKQENISALTALCKVLKTCVGPQGKLKLVRNSSGVHTIITSSSQRLFPSISIKNCFSKLITSSARSQIQKYKDGGLRCALFTLSLIEHSISCDIPTPQLAASYECFIKILQECFESDDNSCIQKIDFSNLKTLELIVLTLLSSKPGCLLSQSDKDYLSRLLLETFLNVFPSAPRILDNYNVKFLTSEGNDVKESKLFNGLLIRLPKLDWALLSKSSFTSAKAVLFTMSFSGDVDLPSQKFNVSNSFSLSEAILKHLKGIILKLISENVDLVFCQKVMHPNLKKQLNDAGITVFDQLGCESATYLQYILGGSVNASLFTKLSFGVVSYDKEEIGKNCYILLRTNSHPFCSFLICNYNEEVLLELKVVCQQVISTLFQLLRNPRVCFGAGCTEVYTAITLIKKVNNDLNKIAATLGCTETKVLSALQIFIHSMVDIALSSHQGSRLDFAVDGTHGHLWKLYKGKYPSEENTCACGHYSASSLTDSSWHYLYNLENIACNLNLKFSEENDSVLRTNSLDALNCKSNCFTQGGAVATMMLKTTQCISCGTPK